MNLTNYERETIINFNQAEPDANVYTYNPQLIRRLDDLSVSDSRVRLIRKTKDMREYEIPRGWVKVVPPRVLSEEARQKNAERLRSYREQSNS